MVLVGLLVGALVVVEGAAEKRHVSNEPPSLLCAETGRMAGGGCAVGRESYLQRLLVDEPEALLEELELDEELLDDLDVVVGAAVVETLALVVAGGPPANWNCGL